MDGNGDRSVLQELPIALLAGDESFAKDDGVDHLAPGRARRMVYAPGPDYAGPPGLLSIYAEPKRKVG